MSLYYATSPSPSRLRDDRRSHRAAALFVLLTAFFAATFSQPARADEDLPGRVGRVAELAGELFLSPADAPEQWAAIGLNYPVTEGDNLWAGNDARAEIDFGAGQFRLAGNTNLHLSRLDDRQFALFIAQGRISVRVRVLDAGEVARVDTPNAQVTLTRPGLYRIDVSEDRQLSALAVREGEANVQTAGGLQQVLPGQSAEVLGADAQYASVRNGLGSDGFDAWVANRDRRYERGRSNNFVSREMVGWTDLEDHGTWAQVPEYGALWTPNDVGADWAPYRNGYWAQVGGWGPTWVDYAPWGYAPFHYGRWVFVGGRWGWAPGAYVARPFWAPALVGWTGGAAWSFSVSAGAPVYGWVPLAWGEPYRPWWSRCSNGCWQRYNRPYAVDVTVRPSGPPPRYINLDAPGGMTAMPAAAFVARRPVRQNMVPVTGGMASLAPRLDTAPVVRAEVGRIPVPRVPGAPPPASTFYRTNVERGPSGGLGAASGAVVAVPPSMRPATPPGGGGMVAAPPAVPGAMDPRATTRGGSSMASTPRAPAAPLSAAPVVVAPAQPSMQRVPSRPGPASPQLAAPVPVPPSMAPMTRAPTPAPTPLLRTVPVAPQVAAPVPAPVPAPAVVPVKPAGTPVQRAQREPADKLDRIDKGAPK